MVGKLIYFTNIHLNILFTTNVISQYMSAPHKVHLEATKHMLYHIKGIQEFENFYEVGDNNGLHGFTNADWARNCEEQKSTSYIFQLSNRLIIWCSCKQLVVALSSIEAKYRTLTKGAKINVANILMKSLGKNKFQKFKSMMEVNDLHMILTL